MTLRTRVIYGISLCLMFVAGYCVGHVERKADCTADIKQARFDQHFQDMPTVFVEKDGTRVFQIDHKTFYDEASCNKRVTTATQFLQSQCRIGEIGIADRAMKVIRAQGAAMNQQAAVLQMYEKALGKQHPEITPTWPCKEGETFNAWTCEHFGKNWVWEQHGNAAQSK